MILVSVTFDRPGSGHASELMHILYLEYECLAPAHGQRTDKWDREENRPERAGPFPAILRLRLKARQQAVKLEAQVSIDLAECCLCQSLVKHLHQSTHGLT